MQRETVLWLDANALDRNLSFFKQRTGKNTRILVNLKANAYGHGAVITGRYLQKKVDYFSVAYANEGHELRRHQITTPLLVFNPPLDPYEQFFEDRLEPVFYHPEQMEIYRRFLNQTGLKSYPVHLKLDTGMHRSGLLPSLLNVALEKLKAPEFRLVSVYSHLAAADDPAEDPFTLGQIRLFDELSRNVLKIFPNAFRHLANSAALLRFDNVAYDMVRPGIGIYGYTTVQGAENLLKPVARLRSRITQVREINEGESVGYNRRFTASRKSRIALVPLGYGDGYFRLFGNGRAYVTVEGQKAPVIGVVSMDMLTVDVTAVPQANTGSEVCIFGQDPSVYDLARIAQTIPYEITTALHQRVIRKWENPDKQNFH